MANWRKINSKNEAAKRRKAQEAKEQFAAIVHEINESEVEELQYIQSTFKKDGKFYCVSYIGTHAPGVESVACQRGWSDYRVISKVGRKTKWSSGEWVS